MNQVEAMAVFVAVADAGSLSAGARALEMPLATVSRRMADLEAYLGSPLLLRSTRGLTLTEAGQGFLAASRRILEDLREAELAAAGEYTAPRGGLTLTAPVVFGRRHVLPVVADFLAQYPEVDVRLLLGDRNLNLVEDHVDLAVRIGPLPDSRLTATRLGEVRVITIATPAHLEQFGTPAAPADLADHPCVTFTALSGTQRWTYPAEDGREQAVAVRTRLAVNTAEAAISGVLAGVGVARVIDYQVADLLRTGRVQRILAAFEPVPMPVHLLFMRQGPLTQKLRAFLDFAAPRLRERLAPAT